MNRTIVVAATACLAIGSLPALPAPQTPPPAAAQADPIGDLAAAMRAAEAKQQSVAITMRTEGRFTADFTATTRGTLHVARGAQPLVHTRCEFDAGDGIRGRTESLQNKDGILWFEDSPVAGEVHLHFDARLVADLEWAGRVLGRDDLPGMPPAEGAGWRLDGAPLGSAVLAAVRRQFDLVVEARTTRDGDTGTWLAGPRKKGLDVQDPGLPVADRVALFVRARDLALLELAQFEGETRVQHLVVESIAIDGELPEQARRVDAGGLRPLPARDHPPMREQIDQVLEAAEAKCEKEAAARNDKLPPEQQVRPEVRPSRR